MLSQLPKDIVPIIYKYIHKSKFDECNAEYRKKFMSKWSGKVNCFDEHNFILNYRTYILDEGLYKWKFGRHRMDDIANIVFKFDRNFIVGPLPQNY